MSDTPRVDEILEQANQGIYHFSMEELARQLERELAEARKDAVFLREKISMFESSLNSEHTHRCIKCALAYTPIDSNEDCPACGCDGLNAAMAAPKP